MRLDRLDDAPNWGATSIFSGLLPFIGYAKTKIQAQLVLSAYSDQAEMKIGRAEYRVELDSIVHKYLMTNSPQNSYLGATSQIVRGGIATYPNAAETTNQKRRRKLRRRF